VYQHYGVDILPRLPNLALSHDIRSCDLQPLVNIIPTVFVVPPGTCGIAPYSRGMQLYSVVVDSLIRKVGRQHHAWCCWPSFICLCLIETSLHVTKVASLIVLIVLKVGNLNISIFLARKIALQ
jgi:hypothetical protein